MQQPAVMELTRHEPPEQQDRVTLLLQVTHEAVGERTVTVRSAGDLMLQASGRTACQLPKLSAGEKWTRLGTGWIELPDLGLVVVENLERQRASRQAYAQRTPRSEKVLLVCQSVDEPPQDSALAWRVEPGLAVPFFVNCPVPLWIRAVRAPVLYRATAISS
jgi:hypothetical protein